MRLVENIEFLEIEHKFVMPDSFDPSGFLSKVRELGPHGESNVLVTDTYYLCQANPGHIYRHRLDEEIQHLTLKSLTDDPDTRLEVNLDLGHHKGDQGRRVAAFLEPLGIQWSGMIEKEVHAYYFPKFEIVYYLANYRDRSVKCIEIEATSYQSIEEGKNILLEVEKQLEMNSDERSKESLFHLLLLDDVRKQLGKF